MDTRNLHSIVKTLPRQSWAMAFSILLGTGSSQVQAQSIDYGSLQELFGEPVTISVTGSPQRKSEVPATMDIITAEDIRRSGARDIPGVLRHVAGIDVLQWGNDNADVAIRGYNQALSPRLLVLIDGRQVYADFYGFTPWSVLPVELQGIRQIEVVKGPNSALFGFNAVGGVINIITYHPLHDDVDTVSVSGGTQGLAQGSLVATTRLGEATGLRLFVGGHSNDDFSTAQNVLDAGSRRGNERKEFNLEGIFQISPRSDLSIEVTHAETEQPDEIVTYQMVFEDYDISSAQAVLSADTGFGLLQAKLYGNSLKVTADLGTGGLFNFNNDVVVAQLQDIFQIGTRHTLRAAVEYRNNKVNTTPLSGAHVFSEILAASGMWAWKIAPDLTLTNAVRVDHMALGRNGYLPPGFSLSNADWNNQSLTEPSFNSGLVWTAGESGTFRATIARGVQTPSLSIFGASLIELVPGLPLYSSGNPFVDPAIVMNYELGWERMIPALAAKFRINAFYETTKDIATLIGGHPLSATLVSTSANLGDSDSHGLEISIDGTLLDNWRWGLSYTPQMINDHRRSGFSVESTLVEFEHTHPEHVINGNLGWARGPWEVDGYFRYQSDFQMLQNSGGVTGILVPISDYVSVDGRVAYRLSSKVTLALSGQNLLHGEQQQTSAAAVERRVLATASMDF